MKTNKKIYIINVLVLLLIILGSQQVIARYFINGTKTVNISSETSTVDISIDKTIGNITTKTDSDVFTVTIENNNNYPITYTVKGSESRINVNGEVSSAILAENSSVNVPITMTQKSDIIYTTISDPAGIIVNIEKPYKLESKEFNLTINTCNYNLEELIFAHNTLKTTTPNFKENVTTAASSGMFKTTDESGDTYYFRGVIENNYVSFANKIWRIIRINGDGSYRLILNEFSGTSAFASTMSTTYNNIGYMYSSASTPTANTYNSTLKTYLENWYTNNIESSYNDFIDRDAIFWQDRKVSTTSGTYIYYAGWTRIVNNTPSLVASVTADMFSTTTKKGNGKLSKPIGLITADEVVLAGGTMTDAETGNFGTYYDNRLCYLNLEGSQPYGIWTMTPRRFVTNAPNNSHMIVSKPQAIIYSEPAYHATTVRCVKPVINLKSTVMCKGTGTETDPYLIREVE